MEDDDDDDTMITSSTTMISVPEVEIEEEPLTINPDSDILEPVDDGSRGYRRYRSNLHGKNKTRPWRDDTSVFDAY